MAPKKNKTAKGKFPAMIPLPPIEDVEKRSEGFWKKVKLKGATLAVQNSYLLVTIENEAKLANIRATIDREMQKFIQSNRPLTKKLPKMKNPNIKKGQTRHKKLISHDIIRRSRVRDCQYSKQINQILRNKRRHSNKMKMMWKQWYIDRRKFNVNFKAISQYFDKVIRQRYNEVSLCRLEKRSKFEYYQQKILGRRRDRLKEKCIHRVKRIFKSRKTKNALTCNPVLDKLSGIKPITSKMKFITADAAKTMRFHLKNKPESHLAMISNGKLGGNYDFSLFPWVDRILIDSRNFMIRYYNQQIFIYKASYDTNRRSKQNLVHTFSTLNENQMKFDQRTEYNRFTPIKQPTPVLQQNRNFSETKKSEAARRPAPQISASVKIKPK